MHEIWTIAIDDPVTWTSVNLSVSLYVCHEDDCSYLFARWRHFDAAITTLLRDPVLGGDT